MSYLLLVSLIWAFSFGIIKTNLADLDSNFIAALRLGLALLVFLPFFKPGLVDRRITLKLGLIGAVQYGGMYVAYLYSFRYLQAYEVALFTIFTPLYVTLLDDCLVRRVRWVSLAAVLLTIAGAWIVKSGSALPPGLLAGFLVVQLSNLCFAFGQVYYRHVMARRLPSGRAMNDRQIFAIPYLGGFLLAGLAAGFSILFHVVQGSPVNLTPTASQWLALLYLGVISSGLCFFLWNVGARKVNAGALAIFNDLKIPLAVAVSLLFFGESADLLRLFLGGGLGALALLLNEWGLKRSSSQLVSEPKLG